jgi:hypothetical protein
VYLAGWSILISFLVPRWVVLEFLGVLQTGAASTLPLAIVLIGTFIRALLSLRSCTHPVALPAIQHLILSTQHLASNNDTRSLGESQSHSHNKNRRRQSASTVVFGAAESTQAIELQSGVFMNNTKTSRAPTDGSSNHTKGMLSV